MKYMPKVAEIEAVRFIEDDPASLEAIVSLMAGEIDKKPDGWLKGVGDTVTHVWNNVEKKWLPVNDGDYILRGTHGEYYTMSKHAFEANFDQWRPLTKEDVDDAIATIKQAITGIVSDMADQDLYGRGRIESLQDQQKVLENERDEK